MKNNLPYNVMRHADWDFAPKMPQVVVPAIAGALGGGTIATIAAYAIYYVATTAITSAALRALAPDMPTAGGAQNVGTLINAREATATQEYVYGQVRKGGTIVFMESTDINRSDYPENGYMHIVIAMAGHEVEEIGDVYINDEIVTIDEDGFVTSSEWTLKNSPDGGALPPEAQGQPAIRIKRYNGSQTTADADLVAETSATSSFVGNGIAYMYVRVQFDRTTFANGIPVFTAVVKGKKVEDANGTPQVYPASANAALVIRDYLKSEYGLADSSVDDTYFAVAANDCNDNINLSGGGTEKRYQINGVVNAGSTIGSALQDMVSACNGQLFLSGGLWRLKVGVYDASVKTLTLDDVRSAISLPTKQSRRDNFNRVVGKFINGGDSGGGVNPNAGDWVEADYPAITSDAFLAEDNSVENQIDLPLMMVTSSAQAQRVAKQTLFRSREQITFSAEFGLNAMDIEIGDVVALTIDKYGWVAKEFECVNWKLTFSDQGQLTISMTLRETSEAAFDWDAEESAIINNNTNLPKYTGGLSISDLSVDDGPTRVAGDGTYIAGAIVSWTGAASFGIKHYEVQWKRASDSSYTAATSSLTTFDVYPLQDGVSYDFRVRAVGSNDATGTWLETTYTAGGDTTAPAAPTSLSVTGELGGFDIEWTNPNDADFSYVKVYESDDNVFGNATFIGQSSGSNFLRRNLSPLVTKYYWVSAVDYSGNESATTGPQSATTAQITAGDIGDAVIAYENLDTSVTNVLDGFDTDIQAAQATLLTKVDIADYNITVDYQQQLEDATNQLATDALQLALNASSLESRINDAGITVDPDTGSVTIQGLSAIEDRVSTAEIDLDAVEASLTLKASTTYVDSAIAAAQLPEATVTELENTIARVDTAEIDIDALEGAITLTSTGSLYDVNDGTLGVEALEGRITVAEGNIALKASQTELDDVDTRLSSAEITLGSLDVAEINFSVSEVRAISEKQDDLADLTLQEVLGRYNERKFVREDISFARQSLTADVNDQREALAQATLELGVRIDENTASIVSEQTVRANADSALASDITTLQVNVADNAAAIVTEQTVRADADSALATSITALQTEVDGNTAAIQTEQTARSDADSALATSITNLTATVTDNTADIVANTAAISTEATARADADSALATDITNLTATVTDNTTDITANTAAIATEATARADADSALATDITNLTTTVSDNTAAIATEATARADADTALATDIANLTTTVGDNTAAIATEATARADADTALATDITNLTTTVGDNTTSITTLSESINGVEAKYGVTIDNNGNATGFQLLSGADGSAFNVRADQFAVFDADDNGGATPFTIFTSPRTIGGVVYPAGTYIENAYIDNAAIVDASITNAKIDDLAVTNAKIADASIDNAKISNLSADKINAGTISVDYLPGLTDINQTITTSNVNLVSAFPSQYLITTTLSGIRAGTKVIGILTLNAYSTTGDQGTIYPCTMEIIPQNITGLTAHTFTKNNHPQLGTSSSFMPMQIFIGTGTATGTSCQVQFRLGTAFSGETATMLSGASLTLLGYEV
jgi:hypothetical protein